MQDDKLTLATAELSRAAPSCWKEFLAAFEAHAEARKSDLLRSSLEELQRAQGRAQLASSLFDLFSNAVKDAARIAERKERRSN